MVGTNNIVVGVLLNEPLLELKLRVARMGYRRAGASMGFGGAYIADVINGRRPMSERLAKSLGYRKVEAWVKFEPETVPTPPTGALDLD